MESFNAHDKNTTPVAVALLETLHSACSWLSQIAVKYFILAFDFEGPPFLPFLQGFSLLGSLDSHNRIRNRMRDMRATESKHI